MSLRIGSAAVSVAYRGAHPVTHAYYGGAVVFGAAPVFVDYVTWTRAAALDWSPGDVSSQNADAIAGRPGTPYLYGINRTGTAITVKAWDAGTLARVPTEDVSGTSALWIDMRDVDLSPDADGYLYALQASHGNSAPAVVRLALATGVVSHLFDYSAADAPNSTGLAVGAVYVWIASHDGQSLVAFERATGVRVPAQDFALGYGPGGIAINRTHAFVTQYNTVTVRQYSLSTKALVATLTAAPAGITGCMVRDDRLYGYGTLTSAGSAAYAWTGEVA